jgi:hypothetical protein
MYMCIHMYVYMYIHIQIYIYIITAAIHQRKVSDIPKSEKIKKGYQQSSGSRSSEGSSHEDSFDYDTSDSISEEEESVEVHHHTYISYILFALDCSIRMIRSKGCICNYCHYHD